MALLEKGEHMDVKNLMSGNEMQVASALREAIRSDQSSKAKGKARIGQRYYDYKHDILKNRIFYLDKNDKLKEDTYASNIRIPHPFFTEQVEQKVQTLLSKPLEVTAEDENFQGLLDEYYNEDMQVFLQEMVEGAAIKGVEFAYARTTSDDRLCFEVSDSLQTFDVYDENNDRQATIRYYEKEITKDGKSSTLKFAEIWTAKDVTFYRAVDDGAYKLDANQPQNPRPHVLAIADDGSQLGRSYGDIPFYRMTNNAKEKTDLEPIKPLIDDYDLMACFLSNNLQDFAEAIYVVKGFQGDDLDKLRQNIKSKKTVGVAPDGGVDIQTVQIPVEARQTKLNIDKEAIYHFGMAFDSTQVADSNGTVTNVAIQSGYSLLNMKCNKAETRLRALLRWMNQLIVEDIKRRTDKAYNADDIEITITRETVVNKAELAEVENLEAQTRQAVIESILAAAPRLDDESVLKLICEQFELDFDEVSSMLAEQDYTPSLQDGTDPVEDDENGQGPTE